MPILYESYTEFTLERGNTYKIGFHVKHYSSCPQKTRQTVLSRLRSHNWFSHGLELQEAQVNATSSDVTGTLNLKVHQSFIAWMAVIVLVPAILGFVGTIAKLWVIRQIANPLLAKGPLGLPMIVWILITAAGVLIPLAIILKRK